VPAWMYMSRCFRGFGLAIGIVVAAFAGGAPAVAQNAVPATPAPNTTVERSAKGPTAKAIQIGVYLNVQPDCTSGTDWPYVPVAPDVNVRLVTRSCALLPGLTASIDTAPAPLVSAKTSSSVFANVSDCRGAR